MTKPITQHYSGSYDDRRIQDFVRAAVEPLTRGALIKSVILGDPDGIAFVTATEKRVAHKLGRKPVVCFPVRHLGSSGATWFESTAADVDYVYLTFSANCTVYLLVA